MGKTVFLFAEIFRINKIQPSTAFKADALEKQMLAASALSIVI